MGQQVPARSTLAAAIKKIRPETLEAINRILILDAAKRKIETGDVTRVDCTVVETLMHPPSDSQQIWDCIRALNRLMKKSQAILPRGSFNFPDRKKRIKRRCREIATARRKPARRKAYRDLIKVAEEIRGKAEEAVRRLRSSRSKSANKKRVVEKLRHFLDLLERVLDQARRRVIKGESVPASEKIVSVFEDHTDIIRKDFKNTYYGHKICLNVGETSMVLDCQILKGNPADATLAVKSVSRQKDIHGKDPRQVAFDGGFTSSARP